MKKIIAYKALRHMGYDVKGLRKDGFSFDEKEGTLKNQLDSFLIDKPFEDESSLKPEAVASI